MKRGLLTIVLILVAMLSVSSSKKVPFDYNGTWVVGTMVDAEIAGDMYFYVKLKQDGEKLTGTYYSISPKMARRDCNSGNKVEGMVHKNIGTVEFRSAEWGGGGTAVLRPVDKNTVAWHITSEVKTGNADFGHWCPNRVKLQRK